MKRNAVRPRAPTPLPLADLIDLRDDLASAKNLAAAAYLTCHALNPGSERSALCEVTNASGEKLEVILRHLDELIAHATKR